MAHVFISVCWATSREGTRVAIRNPWQILAKRLRPRVSLRDFRGLYKSVGESNTRSWGLSVKWGNVIVASGSVLSFWAIQYPRLEAPVRVYANLRTDLPGKDLLLFGPLERS